MSTDLDTRLRGLTELSPPTHGPLGAEELHQRATRIQRRALATRAIPAAIIVVALLAGAVALRERSTSTDVVVGPPDAAEGTEAEGLSDADREGVTFLITVAELRHQVDRENVLSAVYGATAGASGRTELDAQRVATDAAVEAYDVQAAAVGARQTEPGANAALTESVKQADNRIERIGTNRQSVDTFQSDPHGLIDAYWNTSASLADIPRAYAQAVDEPDVFRTVFSAMNLGIVNATNASVSALLTVPVEIGYYPGYWGGSANPGDVAKGLCGENPSGAGDSCRSFQQALDQQVDLDQADQMFQQFATSGQKQAFRAADAGSEFDQLKASAFEDGNGVNDLRGVAPGSTAIDPLTFRAAALARIDRFAAAERQIYQSLLDGTAGDEPPPDTIFAPGPSTTTPAAPSTDTTVPAEPPSTASQGNGPPSTDASTTGRSETRRESIEPTTTTAPTEPTTEGR
jgi:hypothetical protein